MQRTGQAHALARRALVGGLDRHCLLERFESRPILNGDIVAATPGSPTAAERALTFAANRHFEVSGTNMTSALSTHAVDGGVTLTTAGATADQAIVHPHEDTTQTSWATTQWDSDNQPAFGGRVDTGSAVTAQILWIGLKLTKDNVVATDDNQIFWRYEAGVGSGYWQMVYSYGGTDVTITYDWDNVSAVAATTGYDLAVRINDDLYPEFYFGGRKVYTGENKMTANITAYIPQAGVEASAAAAKALTVRHLWATRTYANSVAA